MLLEIQPLSRLIRIDSAKLSIGCLLIFWVVGESRRLNDCRRLLFLVLNCGLFRNYSLLVLFDNSHCLLAIYRVITIRIFFLLLSSFLLIK